MIPFPTSRCPSTRPMDAFLYGMPPQHPKRLRLLSFSVMVNPFVLLLLFEMEKEVPLKIIIYL